MAASRGVKKYKNTYSSAVQSLTARKHALVEQFAGLDEQRAKLQLEEEVLNDIVRQQSALQFEIAKLNHTQHADNLQEQQQRVADVSHESPDSKPSQYAAYLLRTAQPADIQRAKTFKPEDWCRHFADLVARLCSLLEIINRRSHQHVGVQHIQTPCKATTPQPSANTSCAAAHLPGAVVQPAEQGDPACMQPVASAHSASSQDDPTAHIIAAAEQVLAGLVDRFMRLVLLQQMLTQDQQPGQHLYAAYRQASLINLATGIQQSETGSKQHWMQAAQAFGASADQTNKLRICYQQYVRCKHVLREEQLATCRQVEQDLDKQMLRLGLQHTDAGSQGSDQSTVQESSTSSSATSVDTASHLQGVLSGIMVTNQMLLSYALEVFSRVQLARYFVACYPFLPQSASVIDPLCNGAAQPHVQQNVAGQQGQAAQQVLTETTQLQSTSAGSLTPGKQAEQSSAAEVEQGQQQQHSVLPIIRAMGSRTVLKRDKHDIQRRQQQLQHQKNSFWKQHPELLVAAATLQYQNGMS